MKLAICYLTCKSNNLEFNLKHLINHINTSKYNTNIDLFKYINDETIDYTVENNNIIFSYDIITKKFNYYSRFYNQCGGTKNLSGLQIFPLLDLFYTHQHYDYYMFYEDDLLLNTDKNLFDNLDYTSDIILQNRRKLDWNWSWYKSSNHNLGRALPATGLLNIYIIKHDVLLDFIVNIINKQYVAHHEMLINNFVLSYYNNTTTYLEDIYKVVTSPNLLNDIDSSMEIIHPIKSKEQYEKIIKEIAI